MQSAVDANSGFVDFMLDQTHGFTHAGVERFNDSIRTYVLAHVSGYNNEILVATKDMAPEQNSELNAEKLRLTLSSSTDKPSIVTSSHASQRGESQTEKPADAQKLLTQASVAEELERPSHESTKTLLTVAAIGSAIIYYLWR